jgi:cysteine desulfuration protein SufE
VTAVETADLPASLAEIAEDFAELPVPERLQLLLEFSEELPELPARYAGAPEKMEQVHECQSPLFLVVEVDEDSAPAPGQRTVSLFFSAPQEAPTTRGFAGILHEGLDQLTVDEILAVPEDAPYRFSLAEAVSPLRLRGMVGMLSRIKRQTALKSRVG